MNQDKMLGFEEVEEMEYEDYFDIEVLLGEAQKVGFWNFPLGSVAIYHYNGLTVRVHRVNERGKEKVEHSVSSRPFGNTGRACRLGF